MAHRSSSLCWTDFLLLRSPPASLLIPLARPVHCLPLQVIFSPTSPSHPWPASLPPALVPQKCTCWTDWSALWEHSRHPARLHGICSRSYSSITYGELYVLRGSSKRQWDPSGDCCCAVLVSQCSGNGRNGLRIAQATRSEMNQDAIKSNADALCCDLFLASLYERHFIKITCVVTWLTGQPPRVFTALSWQDCHECHN